MQVDLDILVYAVIAALLLGRLWSVLGTRNDNEPQRPSPFAPPPPQRPEVPAFIPPRQNIVSRLQPAILPPNSLAGGLAQVTAVYPEFEEKAFVQESRDIFSAIVGAYAAGNLSSITEFLSPELLGHFQRAVDARKAAGQVAQSRIARIKETDILSARSEGAQVFATVKFVSDQENVLRDKTGAVLGGEEGKVEEVTDTWTFARDTQSPGAKWVVVETKG